MHSSNHVAWKGAVAAVGATALCVALGISPASAQSLFDPLVPVNAQGVLGSSARQLVGDASASGGNDVVGMRPLEISPTTPGLGSRETKGTAEVFRASDFGVVVGTSNAGTNAAFIAIGNGLAPQDYTFVLGDESTRLVQGGDGAVSVQNSDGRTVNYVQPPWAVDAKGKQLPTSFTVEGNVLTQHIDTRGATFPVVADPQFGCTVVQCSIYWNHSETHDWATAGILALGGAAAACGLAGPEAVAICAAYAGAIGATAIYADNHNQCVGFSISPLFNNPFAYAGPQCD